MLPPKVGDARRDGVCCSPVVGLVAFVVGMAVIATPVSFNAPREGQAIVTLNSAEAKVGQPLSATSVAGVNRRQGRREKRKTN